MKKTSPLESIGKCSQCDEIDYLYFDDDGNLLCGDCIFENECYRLYDDDDDDDDDI